jgi:hydroxyacylglutathione hydrolase
MFLRQITDSSLAQNAYLIGCQRSGEAIVIDPERDLDRYFQVAAENDLRITAVADTHIHADYLSGARELMERHGATAYLSAEGGPDWQFEWAKGNGNARFLKHGDVINVGNIDIQALLTPGHTPEHLSFLVTDKGGGADEPIALLTGDFIFVGDVGRPDLLESAAGQAGARPCRGISRSCPPTAPAAPAARRWVRLRTASSATNGNSTPPSARR